MVNLIIIIGSSITFTNKIDSTIRFINTIDLFSSHSSSPFIPPSYSSDSSPSPSSESSPSPSDSPEQLSLPPELLECSSPLHTGPKWQNFRNRETEREKIVLLTILYINKSRKDADKYFLCNSQNDSYMKYT